MPYCQLNSMLDANYPKGALNYWKSSFLTELSDDAIDTMIDCFARCPTPMGQLLLEHIHGAATRVGVGDTAFPHRREGYNFLVLAQWMEPADTEPLHRLGARNLRADAAVLRLRPLRELPGRRRGGRSRRRRVRAQLPAAAADQGQVRSEKLLPHEPEHPAVALALLVSHWSVSSEATVSLTTNVPWRELARQEAWWPACDTAIGQNNGSGDTRRVVGGLFCFPKEPSKGGLISQRPPDPRYTRH